MGARALLAMGFPILGGTGCGTQRDMPPLLNENGPTEPDGGVASHEPRNLTGFAAGELETFATHAQLEAYGWAWGPSDGPFGAIPQGGGRYNFFGGAGGGAGCDGSPGGKGIFVFSGTLDHVTGGDGCKRILAPGDAPAGWKFNADYIGGGQVTRFWDHGKSAWMMLVRGEYHWKNPLSSDGLCDHVPCYYASLGLAVSTDDGQSFGVAGEILQLAESLPEVMGQPVNHNIGYGAMVVADASGHHVANPPPDTSTAFFYLFFITTAPDATGTCASTQCTGLARAPYQGLATALTTRDPHAVARAFHKYDSRLSDPWSSPGTGDSPDQSVPGGTNSPLWTDTPGGQMVLYDQTFDAYLMVLPAPPTIVVEASNDLLRWRRIGLPIQDETGFLPYYLTLLGETGDPTIGGPAPRLYFTRFPNGTYPDAYPNYALSTFQARAIVLAPP